MTPQEPDDSARAQLAAALGAESDDEAAAFTDAAAELAMLLPPAAPNPKTKAALMAQIGAVRQASPAAQPEMPTSAPSRRRRARFRRPAIAFAAVAAALLLFFGGFASRGLVGGPGPSPAVNADPVLTILAQPDAVRASHPVSSGGTATLVWSAAAGRAAIILKAESPIPTGKTYELWFIRSGAPIPAGLVSGDHAGPVARELSGQLKPGDEVAITIEPARGSAQPTTKPIVVIPT